MPFDRGIDTIIVTYAFFDNAPNDETAAKTLVKLMTLGNGRSNGMNLKHFAGKIGVSPTAVSKVLKTAMAWTAAPAPFHTIELTNNPFSSILSMYIRKKEIRFVI